MELSVISCTLMAAKDIAESYRLLHHDFYHKQGGKIGREFLFKCPFKAVEGYIMADPAACAVVTITKQFVSQRYFVFMCSWSITFI